MKAGGVRVALGRRRDSLAEEGQLVTEAIAVGIENISGEVPPLSFEITVSADDPAEIRTASQAPRVFQSRDQQPEMQSCSRGPAGRARST